MISMGYEKDAGDPAKLCCADLPRPGKNCRPNEAGRGMDALVARTVVPPPVRAT